MRTVATGMILAASAASAMVLFGAGVAQAASTPNVVGEKYSDAQTAISGAGLTAVISTTVGDHLAQADCYVSNQVSRTEQPAENSGGSAVSQVLVSLNCDGGVAGMHPGFSAASPEGKAAAAAASSSAAAASSSAAAPAA